MTGVEIIAALFLALGTSVMLLAALGLLRFGDVYLRMHAATKSSTLGVGFVVLGVALFFGDILIATKLIALTALFFLTAPIGAQTLARAAHIAGVERVKEAWIDELDQAGGGKTQETGAGKER